MGFRGILGALLVAAIGAAAAVGTGAAAATSGVDRSSSELAETARGERRLGAALLLGQLEDAAASLWWGLVSGAVPAQAGENGYEGLGPVLGLSAQTVDGWHDYGIRWTASGGMVSVWMEGGDDPSRAAAVEVLAAAIGVQLVGFRDDGAAMAGVEFDIPAGHLTAVASSAYSRPIGITRRFRAQTDSEIVVRNWREYADCPEVGGRRPMGMIVRDMSEEVEVRVDGGPGTVTPLPAVDTNLCENLEELAVTMAEPCGGGSRGHRWFRQTATYDEDVVWNAPVPSADNCVLDHPGHTNPPVERTLLRETSLTVCPTGWSLTEPGWIRVHLAEWAPAGRGGAGSVEVGNPVVGRRFEWTQQNARCTPPPPSNNVEDMVWRDRVTGIDYDRKPAAAGHNDGYSHRSNSASGGRSSTQFESDRASHMSQN